VHRLKNTRSPASFRRARFVPGAHVSTSRQEPWAGPGARSGDSGSEPLDALAGLSHRERATGTLGVASTHESSALFNQPGVTFPLNRYSGPSLAGTDAAVARARGARPRTRPALTAVEVWVYKATESIASLAGHFVRESQ